LVPGMVKFMRHGQKQRQFVSIEAVEQQA